MSPASADPAVSGDELDGWSDGDTGDEADVAGDPPAAATPVLDERSRAILAFERRWWRHAGAKEQAVRDTFGVSSTRYYQLLNAVLDDPLALAHDPVLVGRLRRLRAWRDRSRNRRG